MAMRELDAEGFYRETARKYAANANNVRGLAVKESVLAREMREQAERALARVEELKQIPLVGSVLAKVVKASVDADLRVAEELAERSRLSRENAKQMIEKGRQALDESYQSRARKIR